LALIELIKELNVGWGRVPELGDEALTGRQDAKDVRYVTRVAAAISTLFTDESFQLSDHGFRIFAMAHRWLSAIFGASAFLTADHVIRALNLHPEDPGKRIEVRDKDLLKFALLYSLDSEIPLDLDAMWAKDRKIASALFLGILSSRIVLSDAAHAKREKLLEWFPQKLAEMHLNDLPAGFLHDTWMHCTYAATPAKHDIKAALNKVIRAWLMESGFADDLRERRKLTREKPVIVVILDHFHSKHAVYRWFSLLLSGLRPRFRVVGVGIHQPDAPAAALFDKNVVIDTGHLGDAVKAMIAAVYEETPDIVFHLGVGMGLQGLFLANLRLAPIQVASWAHPATTRSPQMDYFLLENYYQPAAPEFSERLLLVPEAAFPSILPPKPAFKRGAKRSDGVLNVAVVLSLMKLNPPLLRTCRAILDRSKVPLRLHILLGGCHGVATMYVDSLVRRILPEAVVYPQMPAEHYYHSLGVADMCLDPYPFGNLTTLMDYASEGVPMISLLGNQIFSGQGALLIKRLGLPEWLVAKTVEEYCDKALELAENTQLRESLSKYLRDAFHPSRVGSLDVFKGDPGLVARTFHSLLEGHDRIQQNDDKLVRLS
jgi:hypothetical protein